MISSLQTFDAVATLHFECGDLPSDVVVFESDHEPNGTFWEGIARYVLQAKADLLDFDCEADAFAVRGDEPVLTILRGVLEPLMSTPDLLAEVIAQAEADGFEFDD